MGRSFGQRVSLLNSHDVPPLADAMTMLIRGQGRAAIHDAGGVKFVRLSGNGMSVLVLDQDWRKILPYLADGTLDPTLNPAPTKLTDGLFIPFDSAWVNLKDVQLRARILNLLYKLFPRNYPISLI